MKLRRLVFSNALITAAWLQFPIALFSKALTSRYWIINILALEMVDQKAGGRSWRCVRFVNSLKAVRTALAVRKIKVHQTPCFYIISHHWFGHVAPTNAFL